MKKALFAVVAAATIFAVSCKKNFDRMAGHEKKLTQTLAIDTLVTEVTSDSTISTKTFVRGIVYVRPGVTLTINAGDTLIFSNGPIVPDTINLKNNKGTIIVERGA